MLIKLRHIWAIIAALCAFYPIFLSAQPQGDEPRRIKAIVESIRERISEADRRLARQPRSAQLYAERGALYIELYRTLYRGDYLSHFYGEKPPELSEAVIASKAVADFDNAIRISPAPDFYAKRGEMYAVRWHAVVSNINWYEEMRQIGDPEWSVFTGGRTEENELKIFEKFIRNPDFAKAVADYEKALRLVADAKLVEEVHQKLARIYLERARIIVGEMQLNRKLVVQPNPYGYSLWDDIEKAIAHVTKSNSGNEHRQLTPFVASWFNLSPVTLRYVLFYKATVAADLYGENEKALRALNAAEKYVDKNEKYDYFICQFYPYRSSLNSKIGNFDAALADANVPYSYPGQPNSICFNAYERRGDAYFGKGDFRAAISDYTREIDGVSATGDLPGLYKKRGLAYLKSGEPKKAIADMTYFIEHGSFSAEGYLLRARARRQAGDETRALEDEKKAKAVVKNLELNAVRRAVYGKIALPGDAPIDAKNAFVRLVYVGGPSEQWTPSVDEKGRFIFTHLKPRAFYLFGYYDVEKDGVPLRFYGRSATMIIEKRRAGPIIIRLDRSARLTNRNKN
jgi:tetratricopeptide (TPR) repeat protein